VPVFGVLISVVLLGEHLLASMLVGGAIAIVGVMMVSRPGAASGASGAGHQKS